MLFNRHPSLAGMVYQQPTQDEIRKMPQFYRADLTMVRELGGTHLKKMVELIQPSRQWKHYSVDSRCSMLMKGMYPCIPGWHCDDFYRPSRDAQPDLSIIEEQAPSEHFIMIFGDCSKTSFLDQDVELPHTCTNDRSYYGECHRLIEEMKLQEEVLVPGEIWRFSPLTWHKGNPATHAGWRYFIRVTGSNHREPKNEIRTQTQVYMTDPFAGW